MSWPFGRFCALNSGSKWTSETGMLGDGFVASVRSAPRSARNVTPSPTVSGETQCAAVRRTVGAMSVAVQSEPPSWPSFVP